MDAGEGFCFRCFGEGFEEFDGFLAGELHPLLRGETGAGRAAEIVLDVADGDGFGEVFEVAVGVAGEFVGVLLLPGFGDIQVPAEDNGGIGTEVGDASNLAAGEGGIEDVVGEEEVELEEFEAGVDKLADALARAFFEGEAAADAIGEGVEGGVGGLVADVESGLVVPGADVGVDGLVRLRGGEGGSEEEGATGERVVHYDMRT